MVFPPRTSAELGLLRHHGTPVPLDIDVVKRVYEAAWYLLPGPIPAFAATKWTFEVATTRLNALPPADAMLPWLVSIADRESRRHRSINQWARRKNQRYPDSTDPTARALHLAEAIGRIAPDHRLALVLRFLLNASNASAGAALGIRPEQVDAFVKNSEILLAAHTMVAARVLGELPPPPPSESLTEVIPMERTQRRRSKLNYGWQSDGFPTKTAYDNQLRRRVIKSGAAAAALCGLVIAFSQLEPLRPTLEQPASADAGRSDIAEPSSGTAGVSSTTVPSTTVPSTTVPSTTAPSTTAPSTTVPSTTEPPGFVFPDLSGVLDADGQTSEPGGAG